MFESLDGVKRVIPARYCAYRNRLPTEQQAHYDKICAAIASRKTSVALDASPAFDSNRVIYAIGKDQTFLYYTSSKYTIQHSILGATVCWEIMLNDSDIAYYDREIIRKLRLLALPHPNEGDVLHREVRIHDMLQDMGICAGKSSDGSDNWKDHSIIGPLLELHTVCDGLSRMFAILCMMSGVPCTVISGIGTDGSNESGPHAWNIVRIGNHYVHVDAYWDLCIHDAVYGHCYDYFNLSDTQIARDHTWEYAYYPKCNTDRFGYFVRSRANISSQAEFQALARRRMEMGKRTVIARFDQTYDVSKCEQEIIKVYGILCLKDYRIRMNKAQNIIEFMLNCR